MRVLTTWMYFDASQIKSDHLLPLRRGRGEEPEPGIGVAWFAGGSATSQEIDNLKVFRRMRREEQSLTEELLRDCLDLFLADAEEIEFSRPERSPTRGLSR
jgi:hypothetical protein